MSDFDLFVIGGGSGGVACARRAASHGARVGLAEARRVGGTCVIRGCVPKKLMRYGAKFGEAIGYAQAYGWRTAEPRLDFEALAETRNREIDRLQAVYISMLERAGVQLFRAYAKLQPERDGERFIVTVGAEKVRARRVLIAVGARPSLPELPGIEHTVTSDQTLEEVYPLPRRVAVVGAGYIGVEFASIFRAFGSEVTIILRGDRPLRGFDEDVRRHLTDEMTMAGVQVWSETTIARITRSGETVVLETSRGPLEVERCIYATGRAPIPNTRGLGLAAHGVRMKGAGQICVDERYQSNVEGLYAVGDCSDHAGHGLPGASWDLTPVAIAEGRAIAECLYNGNATTVAYDTIPTAIFSLPEAASVGMSEARARELGHDVAIYRTLFRPMIHTLTGAQHKTLMKLVVDKASDRVLGCHMVGDDAAEIIQGFAVAMTAGATKAVFDATVALHPTAAEEFVTMHQPVG